MKHTKKMEADVKRKYFIAATLVLIVLLLIVTILPIKATNVTLQFEICGLNDGDLVEISIENQRGEIVTEKVKNYKNLAEIKFDPRYYKIEQMQINSAKEAFKLKSINIYSGTFNTYQDKVLKEVLVEDEQYSESGNGIITLDNDINKEISRCVNSGFELKKYLFILVIMVYALSLVHMLKNGVIFKYVELMLWVVLGIIVLMTFFGDRFHLPDTYNASYSINSETTELSKEELNTIVSGDFIARDNKLKKIHIDVSCDENSVYEDLGVSVIDKESGDIIYSHVFEAGILEAKKGIDISLKPMIKDSENRLYQIEIEPLDKGNNTLKVWLGSDLENHLMAVTSFYDSSFINKIVLIGSVIGLLILILLVFSYKDFKLSPNFVIKVAYTGIICYMILQIFYYAKYIGATPDETAHISYVAYLMENKTIIPDFANMHMYNIDSGILTIQNSTNYLGHPPLYYWILTIPQLLFGGSDIHVNLLRLTSAAMAVVSVCICFYLGYTRLSKRLPYIHLLFAMGVISVPFVTYGFAGVNNDTMSFLGVALAFWGVLRFEEKNRGVLTYLLLASGMFFVVLSKITAGLVLGVAYLIYIIYTCICEKSLKCIINTACAVVIPFILIIVAYFGTIYYRYGGLQPSLEHLNPTEYVMSNFYVPINNRAIYSVRDYIQHYWDLFLSSWSEISSHISISKSSKWFGLDRIIYLILMISPVFLIKIKDHIKASKFCISIFIGMLLAIIMQFYNAFQRFYYVSGYPGGFQSRYYLCWIPILAFSFANVFSYYDKVDSRSVQRIHLIRTVALFSMVLLGYGGFIYSLLVGRT